MVGKLPDEKQLNKMLENEIFGMTEIKEAFFIVRAATSVPILTKAIAALIVRSREEGREAAAKSVKA